MNHITNEQVFDLIKDIPNLELFLDERVIQWHRGHFTIQSRGIDYILRPEDVLAIVVDAAKREMGEDWYGAARDKDGWESYVYTTTEHDGLKITGTQAFAGDTEAAAVLAAFKAWKEKI